MMINISDTTIYPITISDHAPINLDLNKKLKTKHTQRWRFNTSLLQDKEFNTYFTKEWTYFMETNNSPNTSPTLL